MKSLLTLAAISLVSGAALADVSDLLVDAQGNLLPDIVIQLPVNGPIYNAPLDISNSDKVYALVDGSLPSGIYFYDVLDLNFQPLSPLPLADRLFDVVNTNGVITMTRLSSDPSLPPVGVGPGGVGHSMPIFPFVSPAPYLGRPDLLCAKKVLLFELLPTGDFRIVENTYLRIGDGQPATVSGIVFHDTDHDGVRDANEPGIAGSVVKMVSNHPANPGQVVATTTTDNFGAYVFSNVVSGDCSVVLEIDTQLHQATTPLDVRLMNCGCGSQVVDFGKFSVDTQCEGRTPGFWRSNNGIAQIQAGDWWDELSDLNLVNAIGWNYNPTGNVCSWKLYMSGSSAYNMAYKLSSHLAAMKLNVLSGRVSLNCRVQTQCGVMTIAELIDAANAALAHDGYTPPCDPDRALQEKLKNALDKANNNQNWL